jgi:hypothetical protein
MFSCSFNDCDALIDIEDFYCNNHNVDPNILKNNEYLFGNENSKKRHIKYLENEIKKLRSKINFLYEQIDSLESELPQKCPNCDQRAPVITKRGIQINPRAMYGAAEAIYNLCSNCDYIHSWSI